MEERLVSRREIKFRFFNPDKIMIEDHEGWVENIGINEAIRCSEQYGYKIMQFTGLKDKNGKEIYEGDIVRVDSRESSVGIIVYELSSFMINTKFGTFWKLSSKNQSKKNRVEVIGNIYENPQLLK